MITINNLRKSYSGKTVLDIGGLTIGEGEIFGLVGNNGAGKTTLLRLMLDLISADRGTVTIDGHSVAGSERWKDFTTSYLDEAFLIDYLTPEEFFSFIAREYDLTKEEADRRLEEFSRFFNGEVLGQRRKFIRDFSRGNRQKTGIASALFIRSRVLILDEPFNGLDPTSQIILKQMLSECNRERGTTMVISSHDLNHIVELCTRIAIIEKGVIIRDITNSGSAMTELAGYFSAGQ